VNHDDDPGWLPALRPWWHLLIPWLVLIRRPGLDLVGLRRIYLHTGLALAELTIVVAYAFDDPGRHPTWPWFVLVVGSAGALAGLVWSSRSGRRPLPDSPLAVGQAFRALMFIRLGFAASPALYGIVGAEIGRNAESALTGTLVSLALLAWFGPTRSRVDEFERHLRERGSSISLRSALDEAA
jgi:hypothetical protein